MESAALDLKSEREKKKISLAQIAADTRISMRYLQSIEEGRYSDLPGGLYNRAFIKAYCECINLDPLKILERYDSLTADPNPEKKLQTNIPLPPRQHAFSISGPVLIWIIMLLLLAFGLFFSRGWISQLFSSFFTDKTASEERYEASNEAATVPVPKSEKPSGTQEPATNRAPEVNASATSQPVVADTGNRTTLVKDSNRPAVSADSKLQLEITAKEQCWVSVDKDGTPAIRKLMEPGETEVCNAMERVRILLGNAGGVEIKINGKTTKPLGNPGEVIRMNIDLENLQQFIDQSAG